jgi:hypothetical protein
MIGTTLGRYRITGKIGEGRMAAEVALSAFPSLK